MRRNINYKWGYEGYRVRYMITKKGANDLALIWIKGPKADDTIKYVELALEPGTKLNFDCQNYIEEDFIIGLIDKELEEKK